MHYLFTMSNTRHRFPSQSQSRTEATANSKISTGHRLNPEGETLFVKPAAKLVEPDGIEPTT
jgi:hypothetical protein